MVGRIPTTADGMAKDIEAWLADAGDEVDDAAA